MEVIFDLPEYMVGGLPGLLVQHKEPGAGPILQRILGDELLGQIEAEILSSHFHISILPFYAVQCIT